MFRLRYSAWLSCGLIALSAVMMACGASSASPRLQTVRLQLKWSTQAQFAGYYAALAKGYYKQYGLDVQMLDGGYGLAPEQVVAAGAADFGIDWLPSLLVSRDQGADLVNIAQVFPRSGLLEIQRKDSGIKSLADLRGRRLGVWCCGNEFEVYAALRKSGLEPNHDVTIVDQPEDMQQFLSGQVDSAAAMTYNELAQVLEQTNPKTGRLYTLDDLNLISMQQAGTGMLEDGVFVRGAWIAEGKNRDTTKRFLEASFLGWIYCRDHPEDCVQLVLANGPTLGHGHQSWQMNEINALAWPSPQGIGIMDAGSFARTAQIARDFQLIKQPPDANAYRADLADAALAAIKRTGADVSGAGFSKPTVEVTAGGR